MPTPNRFSIKTRMFLTTKSKSTSAVDGPWKPTVAEAVAAYVEKVNRRGLHTRRVLHSFVAERISPKACVGLEVIKATAKAIDHTKAVYQDSNRVFYDINLDETTHLSYLLLEAGLLL